jgi:phage shock protein C
MSAQASTYEKRFCRRTDKAVLGGVCAGFADYFGFNLRVTRLLAVIAFFVAMPMAIISYMAVVFLVPADSGRPANRGFRKRWRRARSEPTPSAPLPTVSDVRVSDVRRRCQSLDKRMVHLEKYVTSSRYNLDREFRNL